MARPSIASAPFQPISALYLSLIHVMRPAWSMTTAPSYKLSNNLTREDAARLRTTASLESRAGTCLATVCA
jgi:hypothetical protein